MADEMTKVTAVRRRWRQKVRPDCSQRVRWTPARARRAVTKIQPDHGQLLDGLGHLRNAYNSNEDAYQDNSRSCNRQSATMSLELSVDPPTASSFIGIAKSVLHTLVCLPSSRRLHRRPPTCTQECLRWNRRILIHWKSPGKL